MSTTEVPDAPAQPGTQALTPQLSTMQRRRIPVTAILEENGSIIDEWKVREWLSRHVPAEHQEKYFDKSLSIASLLKDGTDLCYAISPYLDKGIQYHDPADLPYKQMNNLSKFIGACIILGIKSTFEIPDLYQSKDIPKVLATLKELAIKIPQEADNPPPLPTSSPPPLPSFDTFLLKTPEIDPWATVRRWLSTALNENDLFDVTKTPFLAKRLAISGVLFYKLAIALGADLGYGLREVVYDVVTPEQVAQDYVKTCSKCGITPLFDVSRDLIGKRRGVEGGSIRNVMENIAAVSHYLTQFPKYAEIPPISLNEKTTETAKMLVFDGENAQPTSERETELVHWANTWIRGCTEATLVPSIESVGYGSMHIRNLGGDIRNGVKLIRLITSLAGAPDSRGWHPVPKSLRECKENAVALFKTIEQKSFQQVPGCTPQDVFEGNTPAVCELLNYLRNKFDLDYHYKMYVAIDKEGTISENAATAIEVNVHKSSKHGKHKKKHKYKRHHHHKARKELHGHDNATYESDKDVYSSPSSEESSTSSSSMSSTSSDSASSSSRSLSPDREDGNTPVSSPSPGIPTESPSLSFAPPSSPINHKESLRKTSQKKEKKDKSIEKSSRKPRINTCFSSTDVHSSDTKDGMLGSDSRKKYFTENTKTNSAISLKSKDTELLSESDDIKNSAPPRWCEMMRSPALKDNFYEFMSEHQATEAMDFITEVKVFESHEMPREGMLEEGRKIYEKYIKEGSPSEVNISGAAKSQLTTVFTTNPESANINSRIFSRSYFEVLELVQTDLFCKWTQSKQNWAEIRKSDQNPETGGSVNINGNKSSSDTKHKKSSKLKFLSSLLPKARNARACCLVRNKIAIDLLQSEINYINALRTCRKYLSGTDPSTDIDSGTEDGAPSEDSNDIYSAFTFLYLSHKRFCDGLQEKVRNWSETSTIGDLFLENGELFSGYIQYVKSCAGLLTRINTVVSLRQPLRYSKVLRLGSIATTAALDSVLEHYVVLPTQRMPQYLFSLFDMLKYTTKVQNDYALLTRAVEDTRRVLGEMFVQIDQAPAEHISELLSVITKINGKEAQSLVVPNRWLVRKGPLAGVTLTYITQSGKLHTSTVRRPYCFLFNDVIVCCERLKRKKKHKKVKKFHHSYNFVVQLELCDIHSVYVNKVLEICLEVSNQGCTNDGLVSWTIATDDESERFDWESDLSANISSTNATFHRSRRRARTFAHDSSCTATTPFSNPMPSSDSNSPVVSPSLSSSQKKHPGVFTLNKSKNESTKEDGFNQSPVIGMSLPLESPNQAKDSQMKGVSLAQLAFSSSLTSSTEPNSGPTHKKSGNIGSAQKYKTPMITLTTMELGKQHTTVQTSPSPPQTPPPSYSPTDLH